MPPAAPKEPLYVIVVPPYSLSMQSTKLMEGSFNVIYLKKISEVNRLPAPETGAK